MTDRFRSIFAILLASTLSAAFLIGCESDGDNGDDNDVLGSERISYPREDERISTNPDRPDRLATDLGVPAAANLIEQGENQDLVYRADRPGTIYFVDVDDRRLVFSRKLQQDDQFVYDASAARGTVNGRVVFERTFEDHKYRLYFEPTSR